MIKARIGRIKPKQSAAFYFYFRIFVVVFLVLINYGTLTERFSWNKTNSDVSCRVKFVMFFTSKAGLFTSKAVLFSYFLFSSFIHSIQHFFNFL